MTQTPQTPPGWYPAEGGERWWDGNAWSEHRRPLQQVPGYPPPAYGAQVPAQPNHTLRNVLIVIAVLFVLLLGGCLAIVGMAGKAVNDAVDQATANDSRPGGPDNPLTIEPGTAFDVSGFDYAAGWALGSDTGRDLLDVQGLTVTNNRDSPDLAFVEIRLLQGATVLATSTCTSSDQIPVGRTVTPSCFSGDPLPTGYDSVTISDSF